MFQKNWHFPSIFHSQFAESVDFKNDTVILAPANDGIDMPSQNPMASPHFFCLGAKLLQGQRSFLPQGEGFVFHEKSTTSRPRLNNLVEADLEVFQQQTLKNHMLFHVFSRMQFESQPCLKKKSGSFCLGFCCTCKRGPKVRRTAAQYLESHKPGCHFWPMDVFFFGKFSLWFFAVSIVSIGIWDMSWDNYRMSVPCQTFDSVNGTGGELPPHLRHSSTGKGPGLAFGMERCKSRSACNSWSKAMAIFGLRGVLTISEGSFRVFGFFLGVFLLLIWIDVLIGCTDHVLWYNFCWVNLRLLWIFMRALLFNRKRLEIFKFN